MCESNSFAVNAVVASTTIQNQKYICLRNSGCSNRNTQKQFIHHKHCEGK